MASTAPLSPMKCKELGNIFTLVRPESISFTRCTIESGRTFCVLDDQPTPGKRMLSLFSFDYAAGIVGILKKIPIVADAAISNDLGAVALRSNKVLQVFDLEKKQKLASQMDFFEGEHIEYWSWIDNNTIVVVCSHVIYHWLISENTVHVEFSRTPYLNNSTIIRYRTDPSKQWLACIGLARENQVFVGKVQLYSKKHGNNKNIEAHAACFATLRVDKEVYCTLVYANYNKVYVVSLDDDKNPFKNSINLPFPEDCKHDFPVNLEVSNRWGIAFIVTKLGFLYACELTNVSPVPGILYAERISPETIFASHRVEDDGIVGINKLGQVFVATVETQMVVPYVEKVLMNPSLAKILQARLNRSPSIDDAHTTPSNAGSNLPNVEAENTEASLLPDPVVEFVKGALEEGKWKEAHDKITKEDFNYGEMVGFLKTCQLPVDKVSILLRTICRRFNNMVDAVEFTYFKFHGESSFETQISKLIQEEDPNLITQALVALEMDSQLIKLALAQAMKTSSYLEIPTTQLYLKKLEKLHAVEYGGLVVFVQRALDMGLFKWAIRFLLENNNEDLWREALRKYASQLKDLLVMSTFLVYFKARHVSTIIKAALSLEYTDFTVHLLGTLLTRPSFPFKENTALQNILLVTCIKHAPDNVRHFVRLLNDFDALEVSAIAIEHGLYREAFEILWKRGELKEAAIVLLEYANDLPAAFAFAERCDDNEVWRIVGRAQADKYRAEQQVEN